MSLASPVPARAAPAFVTSASHPPRCGDEAWCKSSPSRLSRPRSYAVAEQLPYSRASGAILFVGAATAVSTTAHLRRRKWRCLAKAKVVCRAEPPAAGDEADIGGVDIAETAEEETLDYVAPSREELISEELALLEASGAFELQRIEEERAEKRRVHTQKKSMLDAWAEETEAVRNDTERRELWGDLKKKSNPARRDRGKRRAEKELEIRQNRGYAVEEVETEDEEDDEQSWIDVWRQAWPEEEAIDPHDPESFGFSYIGEITGAFGLHGEVRIRADDDLVQAGFQPEKYLAYRNFSNWTEKPKRLHLKQRHRRFPRPYQILSGKRVNRRVFAVQLKGVHTVEEAMALRGTQIFALETPEELQKMAKDSADAARLDLYDADTTTFHTSDAFELVDAECYQLVGHLSDDALAEFAFAEDPEAAKAALEAHNIRAVNFGHISGVVPDYKIAKRHAARKAAHDLLDITLRREITAGEGNYLYQPDPNSIYGEYFNMPKTPEAWERVLYVPFVPDMLARIDADVSGKKTVYFTLPKGHVEKCSFTCLKRIVDEKGQLAIPRRANVKALLPAAGKSVAVRRHRQSLKPLYGTAPVPPADKPVNPGGPFQEPSPGVLRPPVRARHEQVDLFDQLK